MIVLMTILAYLLPLPIMVACVYFHAFSTMDLPLRLLAIAATGLAPSALLMVFVLKRVVHLVFAIALVGAAVFGLYHFGLLSQIQ